jgi:hypothetical protein
MKLINVHLGMSLTPTFLLSSLKMAKRWEDGSTTRDPQSTKVA